MKFTGTFQLGRINMTDWKQITGQRLRKAIADGAKVWINASILSAVPVWSGASHGTVKKLARAVGYSFSITPVDGGHPRALGVQAGFAQSQGFVSKDFQKMIYTFTYQTNLWHLVYNEYNNANSASTRESRRFSRLKQPGPYGFQKLGQGVFKEFMDEIRLPNPWFNLKITTKEVG